MLIDALGARERRVLPGEPTRISEVLDLLEAVPRGLRDRGEIPTLTDPSSVDLFNTYRAAALPAHVPAHAPGARRRARRAVRDGARPRRHRADLRLDDAPRAQRGATTTTCTRWNASSSCGARPRSSCVVCCTTRS